MRNGFHFYSFKPFYVQEEASRKEDDNGDSDDQSKNITGGDHKVVKASQNQQGALSSEKTVDDHFKRTQQDNAETPEYQGVQWSHERFAKNPGLGECYFEHDPESFYDILYRECGSCQQEKPYDPVGGISENAQCDQQEKCKNVLSDHIQFRLILKML
jgi:hypothetical protein